MEADLEPALTRPALERAEEGLSPSPNLSFPWASAVFLSAEDYEPTDSNLPALGLCVTHFKG